MPSSSCSPKQFQRDLLRFAFQWLWTYGHGVAKVIKLPFFCHHILNSVIIATKNALCAIIGEHKMNKRVIIALSLL